MTQSTQGFWITRQIALLACAMGMAAPSHALDLEFFDGDLAVTMSHSLTYGVNVSVQSPSRQIVYGGELLPAPASGDAPICTDGDLTCGNGGLNSGPNDGDGHEAYGKGVYSNQFKGTTDLTATWGEFTAFTRVLYFYDTAIQDSDTKPFTNQHYQSKGLNPSNYGAPERVEFHKNAKREIGRDVRTLDAYVAWDTFIGDHPLTLRLGDQVINWGQSTFLPGIGLTNPVDLIRLFSPGFQLRELFKPVGMMFGSFGLTENIAVEAYYQYKNEPIVLPPGGSFFALNNYTGAGAAGNGQGLVCLDGTPTTLTFNDSATGGALEDAAALGGLCIQSAGTDFANDGDEYGLRVQFTLPWLNYTQMSFYGVRYHSRLPHVGANRGGFVPNAGDSICDRATVKCNSVTTLMATNPELFPEAGVKYKEDLWAYGFSFSGNIPGGWTLQGEISYKKDFPMQLSLPTLIDAAAWVDLIVPIAAVNTNLRCSLRQLDTTGSCGNDTGEAKYAASGATQQDLSQTGLGLTTKGDINLPNGAGCDPAKEDCDPACLAANPGAAAWKYDGPCAYDLGGAVAADGDGQGIKPLDFMQTQFTLLKLFPQVLGGDTMIFLTEFIYSKVINMPEPSPTSLVFEKSDFTDFNNRKASAADDWGWAYRVLIRNEYTNLFGTSWGVTPTLVWFHDVNGSPPANSGTFLEGRRQAIFVLPFNWQNKYDIAFKYAWFGGAKDGNVFADRDSVSLTFTAAL